MVNTEQRTGILSLSRISETPQLVRDVFSFAKTSVIDTLYPGFSSGKYLREQYEKDPGILVPSPEIVKDILFLGCKDFDGLKHYTHHLLDEFGETFYVRSTRSNTEQRGMDMTNIKKALTAVETSLNGKIRNTGEPEIAHIYRLLARGIDFINQNVVFFNAQKENIHYTRDTAELQLLLLTLHDFTEPDKKNLMHDGKMVVAGQVQFISDVLDEGSVALYPHSGQRKNGVWLDVYNSDQSQPGIIQSHRLEGINPLYFGFLRVALKALNSAFVQDNNAIETLMSEVSNEAKTILTTQISQQMLHAMPVIAKLIDRDDNACTRSFTYKDGEYSPAELEGVIAKASEILSTYPEAEKILLKTMSDWNRQYYLDILTARNWTGNSVPHGIFYRSIFKLLPSRWAKLILCGVEVDKIFGVKRKPNDKPRIPRPI